MIKGLISRFLSAPAAGKSLNNRASEDRFFGETSLSTYSTTLNTSRDFLNSYIAIGYIASCALTIAGDIARLPYKICDAQGRVIKNSDIDTLFKRPFPGLSFDEFTMILMLHLLLDGNSFILLDQKNAFARNRRLPSELLPLNPSLVEVFDQDGIHTRSIDIRHSYQVGWYQVTTNKSILKIAPENIEQAMIPGPYNLIRGVGIVQQNAPALDADRLTNIFNNAFFYQGAKTQLLITPEGEEYLVGNKFKDFVDQFRREYEGYRNWGKTMFLPNKAKAQVVTLSHKDMEFLDQRKMTREDIAGFFKIPPIVAGIIGAAKYDANQQELQSYFKLTIPRYIPFIQNALTNIVRRFQPEAEFRYIVPNVITKDEAESMFDRGVINGNEYRQFMGLDRVEDEHLNRFYMLLNYLPAEFAAMDPVSPPKLPSGSEDKKSVKYDQSVRMTAHQRMAHIQATRTKAQIQKKIVKSVTSYYRGLERRALAGLEKDYEPIHKKSASFDDIFDFSDEMNIAEREARSFFTSSVTIAVDDVNSLFGSEVDAGSKNPKFMLVVEKLKTNYANQTINSRQEELRDMLKQAFADGVGASEIKGRLKDYFDELTGAESWKAMRIARTESSYAWDQAAKMGYEELGVAYVDIVGCEDNESDCNSKHVPLADLDHLEFHPNHTGTAVPADEKYYRGFSRK